jgi:curli biogenesis system outer membrane secretion channel CsgG
VVRGAGPSIAAALAEPAEGGKYRIAVGRIVDKTGSGKRSLDRELTRLNAEREPVAQLKREAITDGVRDMLVTELFGTERFIVLERAALDDALVEQEFSHGARAGDATAVPLGELEGAELLVLGAITGFDPGVGGTWIPIPFTFGDDDHGVLNLRFSKGEVTMDLRVIDVRTGRVVAAVAVKGVSRKVGASVDAYVDNPALRASVPGALTYYRNTPIEKALQEMVGSAVARIAALTDAG